MRISDWSSDVCSSDLSLLPEGFGNPAETPAPKSSPAPGAAPTPTPAPTNGAAPPSVAPTLGTTTVTPAADAGEEEEEGEEVESGGLKYDLPPGARRLLTRIGPLTPETGGLDRKSTRLNSSH